MSYLEVIERALKGRSVYATAKAWGVSQSALDRYSKGERLPDYDTATKIASEAGIEDGEMMRILADEERKRRQKIGYNTGHADVAQLVEQLIRKHRINTRKFIKKAARFSGFFF